MHVNSHVATCIDAAALTKKHFLAAPVFSPDAAALTKKYIW